MINNIFQTFELYRLTFKYFSQGDSISDAYRYAYRIVKGFK